MNFATVANGCETIKKECQLAHGLQRQGNHDAAITMAAEIVADAETVLSQAQEMLSELEAGKWSSLAD